MTPGGSSSPRRELLVLLLEQLSRCTSICRSVRSSRLVAARPAVGRRRRSTFRRSIDSYGDAAASVSAVSSCPLRSSRSRPSRRAGRRAASGPCSSSTIRFFALVVEDADLVLQVLLHHVELVVLDRLGPLVLLDALAGEDLHVDDDALDARRAASEASRTSPAFSPKIARSSFSSGVSWVSPLGVTLPTRMSPGFTSAPMRMMPLSSRSLSALLGHVRDVAGDLLGPELGVARLDLELLDVDRGVVVLLDQPLGDEDRVLEVVAAPGHEGDEHVAPERQLAEVGARPVGEHLALGDLLAVLARSASG